MKFPDTENKFNTCYPHDMLIRKQAPQGASRMQKVCHFAGFQNKKQSFMHESVHVLMPSQH